MDDTKAADFLISNGAPISLSVVVPVFNSENTLKVLVQTLDHALVGINKELILVNDGSRDRSWEVVCELSSERHWVRGINLMRNYGQHNAVLCGVRAARFPIIVTMDDDLQHPPEAIPLLLAKLKDGHDVVYGTPEEQQHGLLRDFASSITKLALKYAMGANTASQVSAFRAFRSQLRDSFAAYESPFVSLDVLLTWGTTRFSAVRVRHEPRQQGKSNYNVGKLLIIAINLITGFSTVPLQVASLLGFAFTAFGIAVLVYVMVRYLVQGSSVPGFPFLASVIAIFSGAQLFALGIIGEYLARMHFRTMNRPAYTVRTTTESQRRTSQND